MRQEAKDALRGGRFLRGLFGLRRCVVQKGVTRVDLDDVVDQEHSDDLEQVDAFCFRVLGEAEREQREVPAVFSAVFAPRAVGQDVLALDAFEPIDLEQEPNLLL